jgi:hypothetical protein
MNTRGPIELEVFVAIAASFYETVSRELQYGQRMREQDRDASENSLRLMENSQLPQNHRSVVIDLLSRQTVIGPNVYTPQRKLRSS